VAKWGMDVLVENNAAKYLARLNEPNKSRIKRALQKLEQEPPQGDIKSLQGHEASFRLRVGDFRILFKVKETCIAVYKIAPRGQVYKEN